MFKLPWRVIFSTCRLHTFSSYFVGQGDQSNSFWPEDLSKLSTFLCWQCLQGWCVDEFATWKKLFRIGKGDPVDERDGYIYIYIDIETKKTAIRSHRTSFLDVRKMRQMVKVEVCWSAHCLSLRVVFFCVRIALTWPPFDWRKNMDRQE